MRGKGRGSKNFWKDVIFVHSHTVVQKRPSRGSEKMYTYIFRPRELKIVQKRGDCTVSAHFGPILRGPNYPSKTLKIVSQLRKWHPLLVRQEYGTPRVFFDHSDLRDLKNYLGSPWRGRIECGWLISQRIPKITEKGPK